MALMLAWGVLSGPKPFLVWPGLPSQWKDGKIQSPGHSGNRARGFLLSSAMPWLCDLVQVAQPLCALVSPF